MVVETQHTDTTDPAVSSPRRPHHLAHAAPVPVTFLQLGPVRLCKPRLAGGGQIDILPASIEEGIPVCWGTVVRHCAVDRLTACPNNAGISLWVEKHQYSEGDPHCHSSQLNGTNISTGKHLGDEQIVHVRQGEESQAEEEESLSFLLMGEVVVPQHQTGQSGQNH